jgi:hypothetical protein
VYIGDSKQYAASVFRVKIWAAVLSLCFYLWLCLKSFLSFLFLPSILFSTFFLFLWLYSPILGLGCLNKTFRFISVTRCRTVSRTPWTGDQLVARTLLTAPGDCDDDGEVGGMNDFGRGNRGTRRKPSPTPLCPPQIPLARPGREPRAPRWDVSD